MALKISVLTFEKLLQFLFTCLCVSLVSLCAKRHEKPFGIVWKQPWHFWSIATYFDKTSMSSCWTVLRRWCQCFQLEWNDIYGCLIYSTLNSLLKHWIDRLVLFLARWNDLLHKLHLFSLRLLQRFLLIGY